MQDAATTLQLTGRTTECKTADTPGTKGTGSSLRDGDQKLGGNDTAAFRSALGSVMYVALDRPTPPRPWHAIPDEVSDGQGQATGALALRPNGLTPSKLCRSTWTCTVRAIGQATRRSCGDLRRPLARRCVGHAIACRAIQRGGGALRLQPRHRGWIANVSLPDRGGLRGGSASVERQQCLPLNRPQNRLRKAQALGDPTHVDTGAAAERRVPVEGCSYE